MNLILPCKLLPVQSIPSQLLVAGSCCLDNLLCCNSSVMQSTAGVMQLPVLSQCTMMPSGFIVQLQLAAASRIAVRQLTTSTSAS